MDAQLKEDTKIADNGVPVSELIDWYRARWEIEMLFDVLKNGCYVDELQLGSIERIERALALYVMVAWRIAYLMRMGRDCRTWTPSRFSIRTKSKLPICSTRNWPRPPRA